MTTPDRLAERLRDSVFPIERLCSDNGHSVHGFRPFFLKAKPADMTWYGYDVIIHSRTDVEFVAYDMRDNISGGVGKEIGRFKARVPSSLTHEDVENKIYDLAASRRRAELAEAETAILDGYAAEIRAAMGGGK